MEIGEDFAEWHRRADLDLKDRYGINFIDAGLDDQELRTHAAHFPKPAEFMEWFATKYDLTPVREWSWHFTPRK